MDEQWKETVEQFSRVWPRIEGAGPVPANPGPRPRPPMGPPPPGALPPPERDAETLRRLMELEARAAEQYQAMAGAARGKAADTLRRLSAGCERRIKQLQREFFLRTGDSLALPPPRRKKRETLPEGLRRAWSEAGQLEQAYSDAAFAAADAGLRDFYGDKAMESRADRRTLHALAGRLFR